MEMVDEGVVKLSGIDVRHGMRAQHALPPPRKILTFRPGSCSRSLYLGYN